MAQMTFDALDASLVVAGLMSAFMIVGIATFNLFDVDFGATLFTVAGIDLSTAWILGYASTIGIIVTNDNTDFSKLSDDIQRLQGYYLAAAVAALGLPVAFVLLPDTVGAFFSNTDLWGLLYVIVITIGQITLGWAL